MMSVTATLMKTTCHRPLAHPALFLYSRGVDRSAMTGRAAHLARTNRSTSRQLREAIVIAQPGTVARALVVKKTVRAEAFIPATCACRMVCPAVVTTVLVTMWTRRIRDSTPPETSRLMVGGRGMLLLLPLAMAYRRTLR